MLILAKGIQGLSAWGFQKWLLKGIWLSWGALVAPCPSHFLYFLPGLTGAGHEDAAATLPHRRLCTEGVREGRKEPAAFMTSLSSCSTLDFVLYEESSP